MAEVQGGMMRCIHKPGSHSFAGDHCWQTYCGRTYDLCSRPFPASVEDLADVTEDDLCPKCKTAARADIEGEIDGLRAKLGAVGG